VVSEEATLSPITGSVFWKHGDFAICMVNAEPETASVYDEEIDMLFFSPRTPRHFS
jgi:hypothetical protein